VLAEPSADHRRVMQELIARSTRLVVTAKRGRRMLQEVYQAPPARIDLIPHGIHGIPFVAPNDYKDQFGAEGVGARICGTHSFLPCFRQFWGSQ